ncbi:uncharacterized protein BDR25DRAFT_392836 [Lindgomyces ingoldianus]|uniref:Uncharacterized protein n=1 Tax=Lindgomyces ingoldianus TaxID=673940 RepID=A0ACB6QZS3_9PLEO|nr:uncharacterized protein BDR25DRAFT_392836 [Lindgomyces ingoldianus]KAF2472406.1 hypothetical protein BDR25DRAFT_392836 [Lindgomyces ingoldianus]
MTTSFIPVGSLQGLPSFEIYSRTWHWIRHSKGAVLHLGTSSSSNNGSHHSGYPFTVLRLASKHLPDGTSTASLKTNPTNAAPFFSLARELRDQIYHYLWREHPVYFFQFSLHIEFSYGAPNKERFSWPWLPSWLLTNKTILEEGIQQFYRQARCIDIRLTACDARRKCTTSLCACKDKCCGERPGHLLDIRRIRTIDRFGCYDLEIHKENGEPSLIAPEAGDRLVPVYARHVDRDLIKTLRDHPNCLRDIHLDIQLPPYLCKLGAAESIRPWMMENLKPWNADLSSLETIGKKLDRVEFQINYPQMNDRDHTQLKNLVLAFPKLQHELVRVAKVLTSDEAEEHGWIVRDFFLSNEGLRYEWHVEVKRGSKGSPCDLQYEGLRYWKDSNSQHTFHLERTSFEDGVIIFRDWPSGQTIVVDTNSKMTPNQKYPVNIPRILDAHCRSRTLIASIAESDLKIQSCLASN